MMGGTGEKVWENLKMRQNVKRDYYSGVRLQFTSLLSSDRSTGIL